MIAAFLMAVGIFFLFRGIHTRGFERGRMAGLERGYVDGWKAGATETVTCLQGQLLRQGVVIEVIAAEPPPSRAN